MFVLLFGLMGVAAIFPVASHYVLEGDKRDRSSGLAQIAFEELRAQKILRPELWLYAEGYPATASGRSQLINPITNQFNLLSSQGTGHAFVIDPLGSVAVGGSPIRDVFPVDVLNFPNARNPWLTIPPPLAGERWPVRRLTLNANPNLTAVPLPLPGHTAETTFRLRDDLAVDMPDAGDRPSVQRWAVGPGGQMLARQYIGDYSWLATVVPVNQQSLLGLAPTQNVPDAWYEVSAVVFYKRDTVPSASEGSTAGSERIIPAEFTNRSELAVYSPESNVSDAVQQVDTALDGVKPGNWIAVTGVHRVTGAFLMKWYKVQAVEEDTRRSAGPLPRRNLLDLPGAGPNRVGRYLMVQGPDWPESRNAAGNRLSYQNLQVIILPNIVDVYTRVMQLGSNESSFVGTTTAAFGGQGAPGR